jgi:uncharacterized membrane protein
MTAILALGSALVVGSSDFLVGIAARRTKPTLVPMLAHFVSLFVVVPVAIVVTSPSVRSLDLLWGIAAGLAGSVGFMFFSTAMASGQMSIVAPLTSVVGAATTFIVGVAREGRPNTLALVGIALALVAIAIITYESEHDVDARTSPKTVGLALLAGLGFGFFFVFLSFTENDAGMWPLVPGRMASFCFLVAFNLLLHHTLRLDRPAVRPAVWAGQLETLSSVLLLLALRRGPLAVAGVLASLYPISTVMLAGVILKERLDRLQWIGVGLALIAVVLAGVP